MSSGETRQLMAEAQAEDRERRARPLLVFALGNWAAVQFWMVAVGGVFASAWLHGEGGWLALALYGSLWFSARAGRAGAIHLAKWLYVVDGAFAAVHYAAAGKYESLPVLIAVRVMFAFSLHRAAESMW